MTLRMLFTMFAIAALFFARDLSAQATVSIAAPAQVPAGNCSQGQTDFVAFGFGASRTSGASSNLTSVTITNTGTAVAADFVRIRLVRDVNTNTTVDAGDVILGTFTSAAPPITFTGMNDPIPGLPGANVYLIAVDVSATATVGRTFIFSVAANANFVATATIVTGAPINGNVQTVQAPSLCEIDVQRSATSIATGGTDALGNRGTGVPFNLVYTILNTGSANLNLTGAPLINIPALSITNCTAVTTGAAPTTPVAPSGSTTFTIQVTPSANGPFGFGIRIDNNDANENPYNIIVSGTGVAPAPEMDVSRGATPIATPSTDSVGSAFTAGTPASLVYTITNNGSANLTLTNPASITSMVNCGVTISVAPTTPVTASNSTTTTLSVTPAAAGAFSFSYSIANNDANENPYVFSISGTASAAAAPEMDVTRGASPIADGLVSDALGTVASGVAQNVTYTITNSGSAALNLTGATLVVTSSLTNVSSATVTAQPTNTVAALGTTSFTVSYTVTSVGAFSFNISIDNTDANENPYNWTVSGTGAASVPELDVSRAATPIASGATDVYGNAPFGSATAITYTLANTGTGTLNISAAGATAGTNCTVSVTTAAPATIAAASSAPLVISVTPLAAGAFDFSVTITNDDPNESTYTFTVTGTGITGGSGGGSGGGSSGGGGCSTEEATSPALLASLALVLLGVGFALRQKRAA